MKCWLALFFAFAATCAAADDLSDFSNDLATDVGPLLVLFGESMTRQYLSESTSFLDYFIFAMAPIGIITAIVSAIRVCGHSTLRAFIGRSQEGDGVVEAELCTSTSRDVCELFNKGGITRVLGRPQRLELIHVKNLGQEDGLHLFSHYLQNDKSPEKTEWKKVERYIPGIGNLSDDSSSERTLFAPKPNLSLNVGIKRRPRWVFVSIALLGFLLQGGVLALAGVGVWMLGWNLNDSGSSASTNYAPIMFISGTVVMCGGMFWCAALIGQTTLEVRYSREPGTPRSRLIWLQPGRQVIGDQSFDAFAHIENTEKEPLPVWTSSRKDFDERFELYTFFAVTAVLLGYISQFIGLRGMKAWVSLAQLGITVLMSILRGLLRVQRLGRDANKLADVPDMIAGHELDWLAFELALGKSLGTTSFCITGQYNDMDLSGNDSHPDTGPLDESESENSEENQIDFRKILHIRQRLAYLTGQETIRWNNKDFQQWEPLQVKAREPAQKLAAAICKVAETLIRKKAIRKKIKIQIQISASTGIDNKYEEKMIDVALEPPGGSLTKWFVAPSLLEAILGLSMWSLISTNTLHDTDQTRNIISLSENLKWKRIVCYALDGIRRHGTGSSTFAEPSTDVSIWFGPDALRISHNRILIDKGQNRGPATFRGDPRIISSWYQLCGWNTIHNLSKSWLIHGLSTNRHINDMVPLRVALAPTKDLLHQILAQDLFLAVISPLVDMLVTGETTILESGGHVILQNSTVTAVADVLFEFGLATRFEALSCAVSLLGTKVHPDRDTLLSCLTKTANAYRRNSEWERAEMLMQWACLKCRTDLNNYDDILTSADTLDRFLQTLQSTGELYRWSCAQSSSGERLKFGVEGIKWMLQMFNDLSIESSDVKEILDNYHHVSILMEDGISSDRPPQYVSKSNTDTEEDPLVKSICVGDRRMALWNLCFAATGDFDRHQLRQALPLATKNGWTEVVNAILELKGDVDSRDEKGRTSISYCAEYGHLSLLQHFISLGASVNSEDYDDRTPLLFAVKAKQEMAAKKILQARLIRHDTADSEGMTALDWAIVNGLVEIMHLLLDLEARMRPDNRVGHGHLIMVAAKTGNKAILDALLERNIGIESRDHPDDRRPLIIACDEGEKTATELLLRCNALVDAPYDKRSGPNVLVALERGDEEITALLLKYTDNLATYPGIWNSVLEALLRGYWTCAQLVLQEYLASTSMSNGDSVMSSLCVASPQTALLNLLLAIQDTPSAEDHSQHVTDSFSVHESVVRLLIRNGVNLEARNKDGESFLVVAVKQQRMEMIKAILASGADVEPPYAWRRSALSHACETGNEDIVKLLLENNAQVKPSLMLCSYVDKEHPSIRRLLLEAAASDEDREAMR